MEGKNEMLIYQSDDGNIKVDVLFTDETVWLTQEQICILFGKAKSTISEHIANILRKKLQKHWLFGNSNNHST